jgi:hypothetical protein
MGVALMFPLLVSLVFYVVYTGLHAGAVAIVVARRSAHTILILTKNVKYSS